MIKGFNIFGVKNWQTFAALLAGTLSRNKKKNSRAESSWTNPLNAFQKGAHYSFIKFCIYCFSLWYEFLVHYALRVEKNYLLGLDAGPFEFQFLRPRDVSPTYSELRRFISGS